MIKLVFALALSMLLLGCSQADEVPNTDKTTYFKSFDVFKLKGSDTLKKGGKREFVKVGYDSTYLPLYIKYYLPKREVTLILEDSFKLSSGKPVFCYTTSNFLGGKPGRRRVYSFHFEEHKDILYVSLTDTLVHQTENIPPDRNFSFHLYIKQGKNVIVNTSKGEFDYDEENSKLNKERLYAKWFRLLTEKHSSDTGKPITFIRLPPH